jgi:hypothetical protein
LRQIDVVRKCPDHEKLIDATTTPLASIFGSGFLVIVPILAGILAFIMIFAVPAG